MTKLRWLHDDDPPESFPNPHDALIEPPGLLAAGGDLSPERLLYAYRHGIFPWYEQDQPILWWSPDPRAVLMPGEFHASRRLQRKLRRGTYRVTINHAFMAVIDGCAETRRDYPGTWITDDMRTAYLRLHEHGHAHSVEAWLDDELAGGIYGIAIGAIFFGESMFSREPDASKSALAHLSAWLENWKFALIDCQVPSAHLSRLGARLISRRSFLAQLKESCAAPVPTTVWVRNDALPPPLGARIQAL